VHYFRPGPILHFIGKRVPYGMQLEYKTSWRTVLEGDIMTLADRGRQRTAGPWQIRLPTCKSQTCSHETKRHSQRITTATVEQSGLLVCLAVCLNSRMLYIILHSQFRTSYLVCEMVWREIWSHITPFFVLYKTGWKQTEDE
jgi:hypothetical protein